MLTHKSIFTIGAVEIIIMLLLQTQERATNENLGFLMTMTFKAVAENGRRGTLSRVTLLRAAMSHRVGALWTITTTVLSGVLLLQIGEEGKRRRIGAKAGTSLETRSLVRKENIGGKETMAGTRGNATNTRPDGLQTTKMMVRIQKRIDLGNLGLAGILVQTTATNVGAGVDQEKRKGRRMSRPNHDNEATRIGIMTGGGTVVTKMTV